MIIKNDEIIDWKDLQQKVADLFIEMDYETEVSIKVKLAGRGKKEIDVFVRDTMASVNQVYLIECKFWNFNVHQDVIHSFKTIMEETGANTGFVISKIGFQKGAYQAARYTNIHLLTFEELQHKYGTEWLRKMTLKYNSLTKEMKTISHLHFDQYYPMPISNNMFFHTDELFDQLCFYNHLIGRLISISLPEVYNPPKPLILYFNPHCKFENNINFHDNYELQFASTREFFKKIISGAENCLKEFNELYNKAHSSFDALSEIEQDRIMKLSLKAHFLETPIRSLENHLGKDVYKKIIGDLIKSIFDEQ